MTTVAIILAAGQGKRMQAGYNKVFMTLGGKPILEYVLEAFQHCPLIDGVIVVAQKEEVDYFHQFFGSESYSKIIGVVAGGQERQDSVHQGLKLLPDNCQRVLIHDGARPFVSGQIIQRVVEAIQEECGVVAGVPVKDTIKRVADYQMVAETLCRDRLWSIQTPQGFSCKQIVSCYDQAMSDGYYGTDDASLVERYGGHVQVVLGAYENIKVTTPEDITIGEALLRQGNYMADHQGAYSYDSEEGGQM